jgi:hypothetical protein
MQAAVFLLCAATSLLCAALLFRGYARNGTRLLLWSALCFAALTLDNALLFVDVNLLGPDYRLEIARRIIALCGLGALIYGLVWDVK